MMDLYSASSWICLYCFPYVSTISVKLVLQPDTSPTLQDHRYGLAYHVMCLSTFSGFAGYSTACPQTDGSGWVVLGARFCAKVVYPSKRWLNTIGTGTACKCIMLWYQVCYAHHNVFITLGVIHPANLCTICKLLKSTDPGLFFLHWLLYNKLQKKL